jgi:hypothetical protein
MATWWLGSTVNWRHAHRPMARLPKTSIRRTAPLDARPLEAERDQHLTLHQIARAADSGPSTSTNHAFWRLAVDIRTDRIRALNDDLRQYLLGGTSDGRSSKCRPAANAASSAVWLAVSTADCSRATSVMFPPKRVVYATEQVDASSSHPTGRSNSG